MRKILRVLSLALAIFAPGPTAAIAASLQVTPVTIDLTAPTGAGLVTLRNDGKSPITVQVRVFKWVQQNGVDAYVPTKDVAVSPPMTKLAPGSRQTVRVVRTAKASAGQDSYRLFVDEIPQAARRTRNGVEFVLRQSIPVFFSAPGISPAKVAWSASSNGRKLTLTARNSGTDRQKVSRLVLKDQGGKVLARTDGLAGYVLGGSTRRWDFSLPSGATLRGRSLLLTAEDDRGPIRAKVTVSSGG